ncbi:hypothetical protein RvY_07545-2 [Ramazzottius varieornatus]|uniref:SH3 domain-containing protein n=1 Tax=Ramazzottius varieornatus TaxID=947166 RepID=A0A1D1V7L0_RAMVA|nr:hypothetical protein RvY_07545-2 [Ramazzottius varieornatus]
MAAMLARAIFDNVAEESRELPFRKGEMLQVVTQNPNGLNGWWLCRLKGQEGLAPANRLQLLNMDTATEDYDIPKPLLPILSEKTRHSNASSVYDPRRLSKASWQAPDSPPPSLRSYRSSESYSTSFLSPPSSAGSSSGSSRLSIATSDLGFGSSDRSSVEPFGELYDVIPASVNLRRVVNRSPESKPCQSFTAKDEDYDYIDADSRVSPIQPKPKQCTNSMTSEDHYDHLPQRSALPLKTKESKKRDSFVRSMRIYDKLPKQSPRSIEQPVKSETVPVAVMNDRTVPTSISQEPTTVDASRQLPIYEPLQITKQAAVTRISFMQSQVQTTLSHLFGFVSYQRWREIAHLEDRLTNVKLCCENLVNHLRDLIRFLLQAALASARSASDPSLENKLRSLIDAVYASCKKIRDHLLLMNQQNWKANQVTIKGIEEIVATGQILTEDVRKMTAFVLGNAQLIFSEENEMKVQMRPLPTRPDSRKTQPEDPSSPHSQVDHDVEYEDVDYGIVLSTPLQPRSPTLERKILSSYIKEVNEEVTLIRPLIGSFLDQMYSEKTVTSTGTMEKAETIATRTSKLWRLTESISKNLTLQETVELRQKIRKIGGYINTACKRFNAAVRSATNQPDEAHFRSVKASLDYLSELTQHLRNSTETEV